MHSQNPLLHLRPEWRTVWWRRRSIRTAFILGISMLILSGCENFPILSRVHQAVDFALSGQPDVPLTRARIDSLPYASIRAKMGRSGKLLMILGRYDKDELHWVSSDHAIIATRHGRIVKTVGLKFDLIETRFPDADPIATSTQNLNQMASDEMAPYTRLVDLANEQRYGVPAVSTLRLVGPERIEVLERSHDTLMFKETVSVDQLDWSYENRFWLDAKTGFVWRSIQYFSPALPPVEIEVLKPAG